MVCEEFNQTFCRIYTSVFDVDLFDDLVEEAIEEGPARRDCGSLLYYLN